jgi:hypothetical protein
MRIPPQQESKILSNFSFSVTPYTNVVKTSPWENIHCPCGIVTASLYIACLCVYVRYIHVLNKFCCGGSRPNRPRRPRSEVTPLVRTMTRFITTYRILYGTLCVEPHVIKYTQFNVSKHDKAWCKQNLNYDNFLHLFGFFVFLEVYSQILRSW